MKTNSLTKGVACLAVMLLAGPLWAGLVTIVSPDKAQTNAESRIKKADLEWRDKDQTLYADVTFSNELYVSRGDGLNEEYFLFRLPGVKADPTTRTLYAQDDSGVRVPVATWQDGLLGRHITLAPGAYIHIREAHGAVRVVLTATSTPPAVGERSHWLEENSGLLFDHLVGR
jgi:hypothetical protein